MRHPRTDRKQRGARLAAAIVLSVALATQGVPARAVAVAAPSSGDEALIATSGLDEKSVSALQDGGGGLLAFPAGSGFTVEFDRATGLIRDIVSKGRSLLCRPVQVNLWRAPTDNDRNIRYIWQQARYDQTVVRAYDTRWAPGPDGVTVTARMSVSSDSIQRIADIAAVWTVGTDGRIRMDMDVKKDPVFPDLPRFGLRFFLPKSFDQLSYYGMGPQESYCDKHRASSHGLYTGPVKDQHTDYLKPQENGSHYDSDWVILSDGNERFAVTSAKPFSFNASVYTQEELTKKQHAFELEESPCTILCADYKLNGIGSNSCGPDLLDQYRFSETAFRFSLTVAP